MKRILLIFAIVLGFALTGCKPDQLAGELSVTPETLVYEASGGTQQLSVTSVLPWTLQVKSGADWCVPSRTEGNSSAKVNITVSKNLDGARTAELVFASEGCSPVTVTISQSENNVVDYSHLDIDHASLKAGFTLSPQDANADQPAKIYFKASSSSALYNYTGSVYVHIGLADMENNWLHVPADWNENLEKCKMKKETANVWSILLAPSIREWFGSGETAVNTIAIIARSSDGSKKGVDNDTFIRGIKDDKYVSDTFTPDPVVEESLPAGVQHGINYNADGSVTFVLYEKDKNGNSYDWCYLIGEFNDWERKSEYAMKRDESAGCWWITCTGFEAGREYMFQYYTGSEDMRLRLSDPYAEITYSGDDKWISASTYPDLREYPAETSGYVSAFEIGREAYSWQAADFEIEDKDDLIIYELLLRDFTVNGGKEGNLSLAMEKLDYLETLGVNAIELMPVQEFDGNDSWGYNPNHYFAMDKAYGTREMYKQFIDECHKRGIAVFVDVVYNHLTGNNAFDKMYPLDINPFFNKTAPHPYSVFEDINHENDIIVDHIKRSLGYLLTEYNVDGFRFDLTKGFTNKKSTESTASNYDASRVAILKGYNDYIRSVDEDAVVILEHFCDDREEKELAEAGMKVWRNINYAYGQAAQGTKKDSGFSGLWTGSNSMKFGAYVGFMESHDEERNAFRQKTYGVEGVKGDLAVMMKRLELNAAFFFTVPGPKMIWQFGELGYDISINDGDRTGRKAPKWEYLDVPERKALYDTYCALIKFRKDNPEFFDASASFSWKAGSNDWDNGRFITCTAGSKAFVVVGNFTTEERTFATEMPSAGTWTNHFDRSETYDGASLQITLPAGGFKLLTNF